jgi:hypothetical protein
VVDANIERIEAEDQRQHHHGLEPARREGDERLRQPDAGEA